MFVPVFLFVFLLCQTSAEPHKVKYRCSDSSNDDYSMTFNPALDKVSGRYTAELCTLKNPNWTDWTIDLMYYDNPKYCDGSRWLLRPGKQHSTNTLDIQDTLNCTHVCYAMNFDLIFSSCYGVKSTFKKDSIIKDKKISMPPHDSYHNISNNLTKTSFSEIMPHVNFVNHEEEVTLYWYLGISPTEFRVEMCPKENKTVECRNEDVTRNCSVQGVTEVQCVLAPPYGCYHVMLVHEAPWTSGLFNNKTFVSFNFCHKEADAPKLEASSARVWWACGGVLLSSCALLAAAALRRALRTRTYHKHVLETWRRNRSAQLAAPVAAGSRPVLLLYAREAELGQRAAAALKALLQAATGGMVYDLFSPEVTALCAAAPACWVRGVLARDDVRVVLLQSPAVAALFQAQLCDQGAALKLQEPLLGRRAMYRAPQFGDQLLQMALRLISETASDHHAYHKYYLATYSELETEILAQVVPYRRYVLPGAAAVLCEDLAGVTPDASLVQEHACAVQELLRHVHDHPDYLMDELVIS